MPAMNAAASPLFRRNLTICSTPHWRATSAVPSRDPSSTISTSTTSMPGIERGRSASVAGSVAASLRQGIWMMSFTRRGNSGTCRDSGDQFFDDAVPGDAAGDLVAGVAHGRRARTIGRESIDG